MSDLNRLTKAELIKKLEAAEKKAAEIDKKVVLDMSFKETPKERTEKEKNQAEKDFYKKMTRGRWTSKDKYQEVLDKQQRGMKF